MKWRVFPRFAPPSPMFDHIAHLLPCSLCAQEILKYPHPSLRRPNELVPLRCKSWQSHWFRTPERTQVIGSYLTLKHVLAFGHSNGIVMAHIQGDCCSCLGGQQQPETLGHTGWTWQIELERGCKQATIDRAIASEKTRTGGVRLFILDLFLLCGRICLYVDW